MQKNIYMETLFKKHRILINRVSTDIIRDAAKNVNWEKNLVVIKGSRGVGKTTMMRQYIKNNYGEVPGEALYCVADSIYFANHSFLDLAERFQMMGGKHLFIDEVHKYDSWSKEVKEIIDLYPDLKLTLSGSSLLQILNADADLSRRALSYTIPGLSFREYLLFYHGLSLCSHSLADILENADKICNDVNSVCRPQKMFEEYLKVGYYPFYDGNDIEYYSRIENVVNYIIEQELTKISGVDSANTRKIQAMMLFLANNLPYEVNIAKLSSYLELNKQTVLSYLTYMRNAELIHLLYSDNKSVTKMQKPDKIYIQNPNMMFALTQDINIGTVRECFAVNQLMTGHSVEYGKSQGDFLIDGKWTFEIGGSDKSFMQIADVPDSYVFADNMEFPIGKKLPLWILGLMY